MLASTLFLGARPAAARDWPYPAVTVDPRIELLAVVHVLSVDTQPLAGFALNETGYAREVKERFWKYRSHPAVGAYLQARKNGLDIIPAENLMLSLSAPPALEESASFGAKREPELVAALRAFAHETDFNRFFEAHRAFYQRCVQDELAGMKGGDDAAVMERYSGLPVSASYAMILAPLGDGKGDLSHIECVPGHPGYKIEGVVGPGRVEEGMPRFQYTPSQRWHIWHELGHSLLDEVLAQYPDEVSASEPAGRPCYENWAQCIRENVVQGLASRLLALSTGPTDASQWHPPDEATVPYIASVAERLKDYEAARQDYPTLTSFYPSLLAIFVEGARPATARPGYRVAPPSSCPGPAGASVSRSTTAVSPQELAEKADALFETGKSTQALRLLDSARQADPGDGGIRLSRSVVLAALGRRDEALTEAGEAVRIGRAAGKPGAALAAEALSTRASLWQQMKRQEEARKDLQEALLLAPADWPRRTEAKARLDALK